MRAGLGRCLPQEGPSCGAASACSRSSPCPAMRAPAPSSSRAPQHCGPTSTMRCAGRQRRGHAAWAAAREVEEVAVNGAATSSPQTQPQQQAAALQQQQLLRGPGTRTVHLGERSGRPKVADALTTPIVQTSTYFFRDTQSVIDFNEGRAASHEYGRYGNPTVAAVQDKLRALEGAEDCLVSASGMNSVTSMLLSLVPAGGHIVTTSDCYWRTRQFMQTFLPKMGVGVSVIAPNDTAALEQALDAHSVSLFFSESPTNPYLRCIDIEKVSKMCHAKGAIVCIDSTFSTPINSKALEFGADLVLHSATKYLAGHNDVLAGCLLGKKDLVQVVRKFHHIMGGVVDPHAAYLLLRGLKTLELRVHRHNSNGMEVARRLSTHPKVERVWYPGLESHPDHANAKKQMGGCGYGGVVSFEVQGGLWDTARFIDNLKIPYIAPSLGGVESLVEMPAVQSYWSFGPEGRAAIGIKENLIRYSIGIEDVEDIWDDIEQAMTYV